MAEALSQRNRHARELFAPLADTYDRYASLLSFGQDPRWRSFLVSRIEADPRDVVLDVACGTGAVALELVRRYGCRVVGVDQSPEMLAAGRARTHAAGASERIAFHESRAEALPFADASFDALTFTYLLRYVDDPGATLSELARVVKPGGRIAMLEFFVPPGRVTRALWNAYVEAVLPRVGRAVSPGWRDVGDFLGESIRGFWNRFPPARLIELWRDAGIEDVRARTATLGGGVVVWGTRGH
ncbi:MAG: ubiquinone/menaquinone biosynthesis methyltransferase [Actinobacteria bacterium]|nr:MAG: ubiquinone/menaquinone biosynthesis methyltransferase [Actinomycetota bacterium]